MGNSPHSRTQELERLRADLAKASQLLDELERRAARKEIKMAADQLFESRIYPRDPEMRFAACVLHGLSKLGSS